MKIYQLAAYGNLTVRRDPHKMYSQKLYRTEKQARVAMPEFAKLVTTPKDENNMMKKGHLVNELWQGLKKGEKALCLEA